ncbi:DUF2934 domain-containing protein [Candidatus Korobacter versatilis]|nr:DUF2934 domain-containing protein [Candidatus Koribacter versatilis]
MEKSKSATATTEKKVTTRRKKSEVPSNGHTEVLAQPTLVPEERIRVRAYELYLSRGRQNGSHESDWFAAEAELRSHTA